MTTRTELIALHRYVEECGKLYERKNAKETADMLEADELIEHRLTRQAFTLAVARDELRMELGDLPEAQAEMLRKIKKLRAAAKLAKDALERNVQHKYPLDIDGAIRKGEAAITALTEAGIE